MAQWIISASVLIAAVCAGRAVLKGKISLRLQYALWALVLVRLLVPVSFFDSAISVLNLNQTQREEAAQVYENTYLSIPVRSYDAAYARVVEEYRAEGIQSAPAQEEIIAQTRVNLTLEQILTGVWIGGMAVMAACLVLANWSFQRRLRRSRQPLEVAWSPVEVYVTGAVRTPCLYGLFRPAIYVTTGAAEDEQTLNYVLTHEITHYRHFDYVWSVLRGVCLVVHWYNPLVWLAAKLSRQDAELACDEGTLQRLGEGARGDYGRTLIRLTCDAGNPNILVSATTMTGGKREIKERIVLLMKKPKTALVTAIAVALCGVILVGCTFTGAKETTQPQEQLQTDPRAESVYQEEKELLEEQIKEAEKEAEAARQATSGVPQELTQEQIDRVKEAFQQVVTLSDGTSTSSSISCFFTSYYSDPSQIDLAEFMRYFSAEAVMDEWWPEVTEEEYQLLRQKEEWYFPEVETLEDMPVPVHKYTSEMIDAVLRKFAGIPLSDLDDAGKSQGGLIYLEETDAYYNCTSDFGPGFFVCTGGVIYDDHVVLYSQNATLTLREEDGNYYIYSHLPNE